MLEDLGFRVTVLAVLGTGVVVSGALRRRADRAGGEVPRSADERPVRAALGVGAVLFYGTLVAWLIHPGLVGWGSVPVAEPARWSGAALLAAGVALALWALTHLGGNVTPTAVAREDAELVGRFGERYAAYAERTGRVLPRLGRSV
ncbi:MAG: hypothetical protein ACODAE_06085 [Gemmatimonadota bacterium]